MSMGPNSATNAVASWNSHVLNAVKLIRPAASFVMSAGTI